MSYRPQASYWREAIAEAAGADAALWALALALADEIDLHDRELAENWLPAAFSPSPEGSVAREVCEGLVSALEGRKVLFRRCGWWPPKGVWAPGELGEKMQAAV